jgi:hypothetical protein
MLEFFFCTNLDGTFCVVKVSPYHLIYFMVNMTMVIMMLFFLFVIIYLFMFDIIQLMKPPSSTMCILNHCQVGIFVGLQPLSHIICYLFI